MNLSVQLSAKHNLILANPVMTASGTSGYGTEKSHLFDIQKLGAFVCKGTTLEPREGNPQPRIVETASGVLNSIGWETTSFWPTPSPLDALLHRRFPNNRLL